MPNTPVPAAVTGLPSAQIIPFPIAEHVRAFEISRELWDKAFVAIRCSEQFASQDAASIDACLEAMLEEYPDGAARVIVENGVALGLLRRATAFLAAVDLRLQASADRILQARGL